MQNERYFGSYARFETENKKDGAALMGSDCIIGEFFTLEFRPFQGTNRAWIINPYGADVGYLDPQISHKLDILTVRGWKLNVIFALAAFTDTPEGGGYWGEVALICYEPSVENDFLPFAKNIASTIGKGIRPQIDLSNQALDSIAKSHGDWQPSQRAALPPIDKKSAILKKSRSFTDSMVQEGRKGNVGCYIISWAFLLIVVAAIIFELKSCGVF